MVTKTKPPKEIKMNPLDTKIKKLLLDSLTEPKNCVKVDVILYKHRAGRVNYWHSIENSSNLDIKSYYFTYNETQIDVHTDEKVELSLYL